MRSHYIGLKWLWGVSISSKHVVYHCMFCSFDRFRPEISILSKTPLILIGPLLYVRVPRYGLCLLIRGSWSRQPSVKTSCSTPRRRPSRVASLPLQRGFQAVGENRSNMFLGKKLLKPPSRPVDRGPLGTLYSGHCTVLQFHCTVL